uniref:Uncharacterized protein n=1 Tax=Skeletonema marinoi TaxID=267567 RepID=A0A7S2KH17_9STRA|mmetsp:Transcript_13136/g.22126  ORF Transcript_13136/g.22126 Transcript_13136/m.22126 type:complete len:192 (+) Transcript_13136:76-651(+)
MNTQLVLLLSLLISLTSAYTTPKPSTAKISHRRAFLSTIASGAATASAYPNDASAATDDDGTSVSNYIRQVFGSPLVGATPNMPTKPIDTDATYDTREARNRAYDEAFQQDARDRDAYYGQMAMRKRQGTNQNVQQYRESLGLDGKGDVRMRVGEERVQGLASLRDLKADYLSSSEDDNDSPQTTAEIPAE